MKVHRVTLTVIDFDDIGATGVKSALENARYPNHCIGPQVKTVETRDCGEWNDDHPLNSLATADEELTRLFSE